MNDQIKDKTGKKDAIFNAIALLGYICCLYIALNIILINPKATPILRQLFVV
jgi:hypothetical protein